MNFAAGEPFNSPPPLGPVVFGAERYGTEVSVDEGDVERLLCVTPGDVDPAPKLSFARNVFVPLTTACRYTCTYCTYYDPPGEASLLSPEAVREICERGASVQPAAAPCSQIRRISSGASSSASPGGS